MSTAQNLNCSACLHNQTGACHASIPSVDSVKGQCWTCPPNTSWNYGVEEQSQNRCVADDGEDNEFLKGEVGPGSMAIENPSRLKEYAHYGANPEQLRTGSLDLGFANVPQKPVIGYMQPLSDLVQGGLASAREERHAANLRTQRGGGSFSGVCPLGWTNCGLQGYPRAGVAGGPCVPYKTDDCKNVASWDGRSWYPSDKFAPVTQALRAPAPHPPTLRGYTDSHAQKLANEAYNVYPGLVSISEQARHGTTTMLPFLF